MTEPSTGILKRQPLNDVHSYLIECDCTESSHNVNAWIEINRENDIEQVEVVFYMEWEHGYLPWKGLWHRLKTTWQVIWGGKIKVSHDILLNPETAKNFANALEKSVADLENQIDNP